MGSRTISTIIKLENESQYRTALKNIAGEQRLLKSELEKVSSEYRNNATSQEALTRKGEVLSQMYEVQNQKLSTLKGALEKASQTRDAEQESLANARAEYDRAKDALDAYGDQVDESDEGYRKAKADLEKWRDEVIKHQTKLDSATASINKYGVQVNRAEVELDKLSDQQEENNRLLDECRQSAQGAAGSMEDFGDSANDAGKNTSGAGDAVDALAGAMVSSGLQQKVSDLTETMRECSEAASDYEMSLAKVGTLADSSVLSQDAMRAGILDLSNEMAIGAEEISEAAYQALSAGVDTANMLNFTRQAAQLSVAGFTETATSVDVLTTVLNAYKLSADQTEAVASKLVKTQDLGKITVDELGKVLGRVIPSAAAYGVNLDNVAAAYARMTAAGNNAENTTTYLSGMMDELADSGSKVAVILKDQTGKSFAELMASGASLGDVLDVIGQSVDNDKVQFANLWSSATAGRGALALLNDGADVFNATLDQMANSSGSVAKNYEQLASTSEFASNRLSVATKNLKIAVGDQLNPVLDKLRNAGADILNKAAEIVSRSPALVATISGVVTALGVLAGGLSALMIAKSVAKAMDALNISMAANPALLIASAIAGVVAILATCASQADETAARVDELTTASQALTETVKSSDDAYKESVASAEAATTMVGQYIDRLAELEAQGVTTAGQQKEYATIVGEINELIPELNAEIDEQTGLLIGGTQALKDHAENWKDAAIAEALYTRYKAQIEAMSDAEFELAMRTAQLTNVQEDRAATEEALTAVQERQRDLQTQIYELTAGGVPIVGEVKEQYDTLQAELNAANAEYETLSGHLIDVKSEESDLQAAVEESSAAVENQSETVNAAEDALELLTEKYPALGEAMTDGLGAAADAADGNLSSVKKTYEDLYNAAHASLTSQIGLFDDLSGKCDMSTQDMIDNLLSQRDAFNSYADNLVLAMERGIDEGLVQQLSDGSTESMMILAELVTGTDEQIDELNATFEGLSEAKDTAAAAMAGVQAEINNKLDETAEDMTTKGQALGGNLVDGLIVGIDGKVAAYERSVTNMADAGVKAYSRVNMINSPSKRYGKLAHWDVEGAIVQYKAETPRLQTAASDMANAGYLAAIRARRQAVPSMVATATTPVSNLDTQMMQILQRILAAVKAGSKIVLDSGELVGCTAGQYDAAMGQRAMLEERGAL